MTGKLPKGGALTVGDRVLVAREETARRCIEIAERHKQEWIRPSAGAAPMVVGSHACQLIMDEIRREFGL